MTDVSTHTGSIITSTRRLFRLFGPGIFGWAATALMTVVVPQC